MAHWHVATGLAGYGPDGSDGFDTASEVTEIPDLVRFELDTAIQGASDDAHACRESADKAFGQGNRDAALEGYRDAFKAIDLADGLVTLHANLDPERANAPVYRDAPDKWTATILQIVADNFPLDLDTRGSGRLYVWECESPDVCEHANEEE